MTASSVPAPTRPASRSALQRLRGWFGNAFWTLLPLLVGLYIASGLDQSGIVDRLRNIVFDQYQRWHPRPYDANTPVRVIIVDNESLEKYGQWPWPHDTFAALVDRLGAAGAASIGFDVVFADRDRLAPQAILERLPQMPEREALRKTMADKGLLANTALAQSVGRAPVVLGYVLSQTGSATAIAPKWGLASAGDNPAPFLPTAAKAILPRPHLLAAARGLGAFNMAPDQDIVVRRVPLFFAFGSGDATSIVPSLTAESLRVAQGANTYVLKASNASGATAFGEKTGMVAARIGQFEIPTGKDGTIRLHFSGSQPARHIPAWKVLDGSFDPKQVAGRIVLIGASAQALADFRATPLEQSVPGVDAHAELLEQVIAGVQLIRPDYARGLEAIVLILGALLLAVMAGRMRALSASIATLVLVSGAALGSWLAFSQTGYLFDPLIPGLTWLATASVGMVSAYRRTEREKQFVRGAFSRYLSPAVVERIAADPSQLSLGGETRDVTILFSDARDFTARSETLDAEGVVRFLNALHTPFTGAILAERGTIDKYIGDGLMAFWNAPLAVPDHANRACAAALAMLECVPEIDALLAADAAARGVSHMPLRIGIGLNSGEVFVGNMGSDQRFDYSIVGDPVNVAARLETATKEFAFPILAAQSTRDAATGYVFVELGAAGLKGKTSETSIFALHGRKEEIDADFDDFLSLHNAALVAAAETPANLENAIALVRAHPVSRLYHGFYDRLIRISKATR